MCILFNRAKGTVSIRIDDPLEQTQNNHSSGMPARWRCRTPTSTKFPGGPISRFFVAVRRSAPKATPLPMVSVGRPAVGVWMRRRRLRAVEWGAVAGCRDFRLRRMAGGISRRTLDLGAATRRRHRRPTATEEIGPIALSTRAPWRPAGRTIFRRGPLWGHRTCLRRRSAKGNGTRRRISRRYVDLCGWEPAVAKKGRGVLRIFEGFPAESPDPRRGWGADASGTCRSDPGQSVWVWRSAWGCLRGFRLVVPNLALTQVRGGPVLAVGGRGSERVGDVARRRSVCVRGGIGGGRRVSETGSGTCPLAGGVDPAVAAGRNVGGWV